MNGMGQHHFLFGAAFVILFFYKLIDEEGLRK